VTGVSTAYRSFLSSPTRRLLTTGLLFVYCCVVPFAAPVLLGGIRIVLVDLLLLFALPLAALERRTYELRANRWLALAIGVVFASLTQVPQTAAVGDCAMRAVRFFAILVPFFLASSAAASDRLVRRSVWAFYVGGLISMVIAVAFYELQVDYWRETQSFQFGDEQRIRAAGIFADSGQFGHLLATWMVVTIAVLPLVSKGVIVRVATVVSMLLGIVCLFISLSRGGIVNLLGALFVGAVLPGGRGAARQLRATLKWPIMFVLVVLTAGYIVAAGTDFLDSTIATLKLRFVEGTLSTASQNPDMALSGRLENWQVAWHLFLGHPILGVGYKAMILVFDVPPDNQFLGFLCEAGVIGAAALVGFILTILGQLLTTCLRGRRTTLHPLSGTARPGIEGILGREQLAWAMVVVWSGQLIQAASADTLTYWGGTPALVALTGLILSMPDSNPSPKLLDVIPS